MNRRFDSHLAWILAAVLLVLHLDFWRPQSADLYWGWLPQEMAYRLGWMALAWLYLEWFTRRVWTGDDDFGTEMGYVG